MATQDSPGCLEPPGQRCRAGAGAGTTQVGTFCPESQLEPTRYFNRSRVGGRSWGRAKVPRTKLFGAGAGATGGGPFFPAGAVGTLKSEPEPEPFKYFQAPLFIGTQHHPAGWCCVPINSGAWKYLNGSGSGSDFNVPTAPAGKNGPPPVAPAPAPNNLVLGTFARPQLRPPTRLRLKYLVGSSCDSGQNVPTWVVPAPAPALHRWPGGSRQPGES